MASNFCQKPKVPNAIEITPNFKAGLHSGHKSHHLVINQ